MSVKRKIKVLIVDDSALVRMLLTQALATSDDIEVVGAAEDPLVAREMIKLHKPDVLTLDIEMPKMDGLTFLKNLMRLRPMPVVMVSSLTQKGANVTVKALELGAIDFIAKPDADSQDTLLDYADLLIEKVTLASEANVTTDRFSASNKKLEIPPPISRSNVSKYDLIAMGASTGGTEALKSILTHLPIGLPPIVMTQHIPPRFSSTFAKRLNDHSQIDVIEVKERIQLLPSHAYLAPGDLHMVVSNNNGNLFSDVHEQPPVNHMIPSVDVLFDSVAVASCERTIAVILTGMGSDGAKGMQQLHTIGAHTIAQDEFTSIVWGMPGSAVKLQAVDEILPLDKIARRIIGLVQTKVSD